MIRRYTPEIVSTLKINEVTFVTFELFQQEKDTGCNSILKRP
jgi:hypothetical protein